MNRLEDERRLAALAATGLTNGADEALDRFAFMVRRVLSVPVGLVSLVDSERQFFPGATGLCEPYSVDRQTPLSHSICQSVVTTGAAIIERDIREVPGLRDSLAIPDLGVVAYAGIPLTDGSGLVLGSLCAIDSEPRVWTDADVDNLTDLAAACSSELRLRAAVREARFAELRAEQSAERIELTAAAAQIISGTEDITTALERLMAMLIPRFADWGYAFLIDDNEKVRQLALRHRDGHPEDMARYSHLLTTSMSELSPTNQVMHGAPPQLISPLPRATIAAASRDDSMASLVDRLGARSFLVVPLTARGRVLGALGLVRASDDDLFAPPDLGVAVDFAARAGAALDSAQLHAQHRRVAEVLQRSLLSELPEPSGLDLSAVYRPSVRNAQVGGDWYDAFVTSDGATTVIIGDVMGHDINAAAAMGQLRGLLRGIGYEHPTSPSRLLRRVDEALQGLRLDVMATCAVARLERIPETSDVWRVTWSSAGHPPPVLASEDGRVESLRGEPNLMLGVDPSIGRQDQTDRLPVGSTLLMFTDGLVENAGLDMDAGLARLANALSTPGSHHPQRACEALAAVAAADDGEDDVAIIAVAPRLLQSQ